MDLDDLPKPNPETGFPRNLENLSIAELEAYISELNVEIKRCEADIARKQAQKNAADSIFGG